MATIKLIKESSFGKAPYYVITIDGVETLGGVSESYMKDMYEAIKENPGILDKTTIEVLYSDEILITKEKE